MTEDAPAIGRASVLVGYDGSPSAATAVEIGALLLPGLAAQIVHLWAPAYAGSAIRHRLLRRARTVNELIKLLEREGSAEAQRLAGQGVSLARAAGWEAQGLVRRAFGEAGLELARLAEELRPAAAVVGGRRWR
jgi:nucleotide-binding universal stress UspA family protein